MNIVDFSNPTPQQKRFIKKLTTIHGPREIISVLDKKDMKKLGLIHQLALSIREAFSYHSGLIYVDGIEVMNIDKLTSNIFDINPRYYDRSRGENQKLSYRRNRLQESFWETRRRLRLNNIVPMVYSFPLYYMVSNAGYRHRWFMVANSPLEAQDIFRTMVLNPLGYSKGERVFESSLEVACHGPSAFVKFDTTNTEELKDIYDGYYSRRKEIQEKLDKIEKTIQDFELTKAILNQTRGFLSG